MRHRLLPLAFLLAALITGCGGTGATHPASGDVYVHRQTGETLHIAAVGTGEALAEFYEAYNDRLYNLGEHVFRARYVSAPRAGACAEETRARMNTSEWLARGGSRADFSDAVCAASNRVIDFAPFEGEMRDVILTPITVLVRDYVLVD